MPLHLGWLPARTSPTSRRWSRYCLLARDYCCGRARSRNSRETRDHMILDPGGTHLRDVHWYRVRGGVAAAFGRCRELGQPRQDRVEVDLTVTSTSPSGSHAVVIAEQRRGMAPLGPLRGVLAFSGVRRDADRRATWDRLRNAGRSCSRTATVRVSGIDEASGPPVQRRANPDTATRGGVADSQAAP